MSQITVQGKQQALMRVAATRVAVLDSVSSVSEHAAGCVRALPVSPAVLMKVGAAAGAAASVLGTMAGFRKRRLQAERKAAGTGASSTWKMLVQLVLPMLLPYLRQFLQSRGYAGDGQSMKF